jgi:FkbM family methyltransferase
MRSRFLPTGERIWFGSSTDVDLLIQEMADDSNIYVKHGVTVGEGDIIVDVGANLGFFLLYLARTLRSATVISIEPVPEIFAMLARNAESAGRLNVRLVQCAVGISTETREFTYFPRMSLASTMYPQTSAAFRASSRNFVRGELARRSRLFEMLWKITPDWVVFPLTESIRRHFHKSKKFLCDVRPLSEILEEHGLARIDLLKIDVEGAEDDVLAGIRGEHWPRIKQIVVEVHGGPAHAEQTCRFLENRGYRAASEPLRTDATHLYVV